MRKKLLVIVVVLVTLVSLTLIVNAAPGGVTDPQALRELAHARQATAKYHNEANALADGYVSTVECVEVPGLGGMGVHYINFGLFGDLSANGQYPEVLLYAPDGDHMRLVGVEYVVTALAKTSVGPVPWFDPTPPPDGFFNAAPTLFTQSFNGPMPGHGPGEPWHYDLHAWIWQGNPAGIFTDFNPHVSC